LRFRTSSHSPEALPHTWHPFCRSNSLYQVTHSSSYPSALLPLSSPAAIIEAQVVEQRGGMGDREEAVGPRECCMGRVRCFGHDVEG